MQEPIIIYTPTLSARLDYICKFIFRDVLQVPFVFTSSLAKLSNTTIPFLNYSTQVLPNGLQIIPHPIIFETNIQAQQIEIATWKNNPTFFTTNGTWIPFDIFSACFYLISRYEEYLPHSLDEYSRFSHAASLAFKNNFLHLPLVDIWCLEMYTALQQANTALQKSPKQFNYIPTFDIDMISAYQHKGILHNLAALGKEFFSGKWKTAKQRLLILRGKQKDNFAAFEEMIAAHKNNASVKYFFLVAAKKSAYDKNISPTHPAMQSIIQKIAKQFIIGIHPSYQTNETPQLLASEIHTLSTTLNSEIAISRQHYIKFKLPDTFVHLAAHGILQDYSMGYGSINGFRASTCTAFKWFNLQQNKMVDLLILPFCWMDANCVYEQKMLPEEAWQNWQAYYAICKKYNGTFIDIWHNFIIGTDTFHKEWGDVWRKTILNNS